MSITDELRKFAWKECPSKFLERVTGIADDIEQAHTMEIGEVTDLFKDCIPLPKDADGVLIHIGDEMEVDGEPNCKFVVCGFTSEFEGEGRLLVNGDGWYPEKLHHVKHDSWEAIIEEAASYGDKRWFSGTQGDKAIIAELVERCKRLAGEDA